MERFKVIKHRNGYKSLIDNQTGMSFCISPEEDIEKAKQTLVKGCPTKQKKDN